MTITFLFCFSHYISKMIKYIKYEKNIQNCFYFFFFNDVQKYHTNDDIEYFSLKT